MFNWIRSLPDPLLVIAMIVFGTMCWIIALCMVVVWSRIKDTMAIRYVNLKRENTRLRKYISKLHKENTHVRI